MIGDKMFGCLRDIICVTIVIFALLMMVASVVLMFPSCTGKFTYGYIMNPSFTGVIFYGLMVLILWLSFEYLGRKWPASFVKLEIVFIMLLVLFVSLCFMMVLPTYMHQENAMAWDSSMVLKSIKSGKICYCHPVRNQYWCNYEILCSILSVLFKHDIIVCRLGQIMVAIGTIFPIYRLCEYIGGRRIARFVTLTMGLSPTLIMYSMLPTSEFLSASLLAFSTYFLIKGCVFEDSKINECCCFVFSGVFLGLSDLFKTLFPVIMGALCILMVIYFCYHKRSFCLRCLMVFIVLIPVSRMTRAMGQIVLSELAQAPQLTTASESTMSSVLYELALGLDVEGEGFWNLQLADKFVSKSKEEQLNFVKEAISRDWKKYPMLMVRKFRNIHGSSCYHHGAVRQFISLFRDEKGFYRPPQWVVPLSDIGTIIFKIIFILGACGLFISRKRSISYLSLGLFAALVILGFAIVEQLIEGHGRYKTAIYPFYFMIIPYMVVWFEKDNPFYHGLVHLWFKFRDRKGVSDV